MRRLPERPPELAAEMRARKSGRRGEVADGERVGVPRVGQVPGTKKVANRRNDDHGDHSLRPRIQPRIIAGARSMNFARRASLIGTRDLDTEVRTRWQGPCC